MGSVRVDFLDLAFDRMTIDQALAWIGARRSAGTFAYVVTPNVDHMVRLPSLPSGLRAAYSGADLCLCDSRILARLAQLAGVELDVVPGSDLTARLLDEGLPPDTHILLVGADVTALAALHARFPQLRFDQVIAPMGLRQDAAARERVVEAAAASDAAILLLAVGSPQQELLAAEMKASGRVCGTALCIGASVDFLVGREKRAPRLVQKAGFEWAWRLGQNPRRLARRYLIDDPKVFAMTWTWARRRRR